MKKIYVIGAGKTGRALAEFFPKLNNEHNEYKVRFFKGDEAKSLRTFKEWEEKPPKCPSLKKKDIIFVLSGADNISGASLKIFEKLFKNENRIRVIYLLPEDLGFLSEGKKQQEKNVRTILQEYALIGYFEELCLVSLLKLGNYFVNVSALEFYDKLYGTVVSAFEAVRNLQKQEMVFGNLTPWQDCARITTLGILDIEKKEEVLFYDLKYAKEKYYYFNANENLLSSERNFRVEVFDLISDRKEDEKQEILYGVFLTEFEVPFCYSYHRSSLNQSFIV